MQTPSRPDRLFFLDWVRILAFFVLIAYHVGMYYVSWDWHVKSPHAGSGPEPFMLLSAPWRLTLLFFVAGVASRFLLEKTGSLPFLGRRSVRLLLPLAFGMLVIVPPQPYFEVVEKLGYASGYGDFMRLYLRGYDGFCREDCLTLPTWNHLWFVAYLWVYTLVLGCAGALAGTARIAAFGHAVARVLTGWRLLVLPALFLALMHQLLSERFPSTHALIDDWHNHATYLPAFLLGALVARSDGLWQAVEGQRRRALGLALAGWVGIVVWFALDHGKHSAQQMALMLPLIRLVYGFCAWSAIVAACGFARRYLNADGPARRYLTDAVFPVYIAHQTLIVVLAHGFKPLDLAPGLEAPLLMAVTAAGSFVLYEAVRRVALLRPLFGLRYNADRPAAQAGNRPASAV
jgi:surface polysaccharide O-acyltransferase-like enzyme